MVKLHTFALNPEKTAATADTKPAGGPSVSANVPVGNTQPTYKNYCDLNNTSSQKSTNNGVAIKDLKNRFSGLYTKYGITREELDKQIKKVLVEKYPQYANFMDMQDPQKFANIKLPQEAITNLYNHLEEVFKTIQESGQQINGETFLKTSDELIMTKTSNFFNKNKGTTSVTLQSIKDAGLFGEFVAVTGKSPKEVEQMSDADIQTVFKSWQKGYNKCNSSDRAEALGIARKIQLAVSHGLEEEIQAMEESGKINDYNLRTLLGIDKNTEITPEIIENYFQKKQEEFIAKINAAKTPEEREKLIAESIEKQDEDFIFMLYATDNKDMAKLHNSIKCLFSENRGKHIKAFFQVLSEEERIKIASNVNNEELKAMILNPDGINGEVDHNGVRGTVIKYSTETANYARHTDFHAEAKKFYDEIKYKIDNNIELTKEEQKFYNYYKNGHAVEIFATANHAYYSDETKKGNLEVLNQDASELYVYREILEQTVEYANESENDLLMPKEEFVAMLDETTNGNYTRVSEDIANGTTTELAPPAERKYADYTIAEPQSKNTDYTTSSKGVSTSVPAATSSTAEYTTENTGYGYHVGYTTYPNNNTHDLAKNFYNNYNNPPQQSETPSTTEVDIKENDKKEKNITFSEATESVSNFISYAEEYGYITALRDVFSNPKGISSMIKNRAERMYEDLNNKTQANILRHINNYGLVALLPHTSDPVLADLEGETFASHYATEMVEVAVEESKEKWA